MRRSDREVKDFSDIISILDQCTVIRLALCDNGKPYVVPLNFGYKAENGKLTLYFHSARQGRKIELIRQNPNICFEADCSFQLITGEEACDWSAAYESVIGEGHAAILENPQEISDALDFIMKKYGFRGKPSYNPKYFAQMAVVRLEIDTLTGKRHER